MTFLQFRRLQHPLSHSENGTNDDHIVSIAALSNVPVMQLESIVHTVDFQHASIRFTSIL